MFGTAITISNTAPLTEAKQYPQPQINVHDGDLESEHFTNEQKKNCKKQITTRRVRGKIAQNQRLKQFLDTIGANQIISLALQQKLAKSSFFETNQLIWSNIQKILYPKHSFW